MGILFLYILGLLGGGNWGRQNMHFFYFFFIAVLDTYPLLSGRPFLLCWIDEGAEAGQLYTMFNTTFTTFVCK